MVMDYLIGNKSCFAIEFNIQPERPSHHLWGRIFLWLGGKYVGTYEEANILSVTLNHLERLSIRNIDCDDFEGMSEEVIYRFITSEDNLEGGDYLFSPGESFDDFGLFVYRHNGMYKFIWELYENPFFEYLNYPKGIQSADVPVNEFNQVVSDFRKRLGELDKLTPIRSS